MTDTNLPNATAEAQQPAEPSESAGEGRLIADGEGVDAESPARTDRSQRDDGLSWATVRRYLLLSAIVGLATLAAWATFQVYLSASAAISIWISADFVPIFRAAFNVVVVLAALAGIVAVLRELS